MTCSPACARFVAGAVPPRPLRVRRWPTSCDSTSTAYAADLVRAGRAPRRGHDGGRACEFGAVEAVKEECRQTRGLRWMDEARQDLRYAVRHDASRRRASPSPSILSLALGIGANTAIFSLMDAVLFRTLPLPEPEELYFLAHDPGTERQYQLELSDLRALPRSARVQRRHGIPWAHVQRVDGRGCRAAARTVRQRQLPRRARRAHRASAAASRAKQIAARRASSR